MEQTIDAEYKPVPGQLTILDILREQIEEEGKAAEKIIFEGVNRKLEEKGPYIADFYRAKTTTEILEIFDLMLNDNNYLENVDMCNLTTELKTIKSLNDNVLKTDIWKSMLSWPWWISNMYKLVELYANIRTPEDLQEKFRRFIALEDKDPYIALFWRAKTTDEILEIFDRMLKDNYYLEHVDMGNLTMELKKIKSLNDNVLNTDIWKSKDIKNMHKLVKKIALDRFIAVYSPTPRQVFMKYSKIFKTNNPYIWTRETARKFGLLLRKMKDEGGSSGGGTKKKRKRPSRKRPSRKRTRHSIK